MILFIKSSYELDRTPPTLNYCLLTQDLLVMEFLLCGRNFPTLRMGKVFNRNLTENWVAYAKSPSDFPNFTQIARLISENLWVASNFRGWVV